MEKKPSEMITEFLNFLETSKHAYESAYAEVGREDSKVQTFLHDIEFAENQKESNKVNSKLRKSRKVRRIAKDKVKLYEYVHKFYTDKQNQNLLKVLRRLQNEQIAEEKYLFGTREFKNRVD